MDKSRWDSNAIFIFFCHSGSPHETKFSCRVPPTLYKVETRKKILDTRIQHCLCVEGRGWACVN